MEKQRCDIPFDQMDDVRIDGCWFVKSEIIKQPDWDHLQEIEKTRREILRKVSGNSSSSSKAVYTFSCL